MDDVTEDSLVLVDELGKGTEVRAGAAIAGAMLERLDTIGCRGIFATSVFFFIVVAAVLQTQASKMSLVPFGFEALEIQVQTFSLSLL